MVATRASGTNAVRYGTMRENVLALTVVLPNGKVIRTSRRARKSSSGYDLTRLFVGSEGTLGIITEATIRLYGIPEAMSAAVVGFPDIASAVNAVILTIQSGIPVARIELLDEVQMDAVNRYSKLDFEVQPTLFLEFHGNEKAVEAQALEFGEIANEHGGSAFRWATETAEREKLWKARHDSYYAALALRPGCKGLTTDVCVPISRLTQCVTETKEDIEQSFLTAPLVGHVGDGNFHLVILIDPNRAEDLEESERLNTRLVQRALSMDGTCSGEHGVGIGKRRFLAEEHGEAMQAMRMVKRALDPQNIMNPGKIVDLEEA
jgi:D-lactate dehydrogenase (cytochrome)